MVPEAELVAAFFTGGLDVAGFFTAGVAVASGVLVVAAGAFDAPGVPDFAFTGSGFFCSRDSGAFLLKLSDEAVDIGGLENLAELFAIIPGRA